MPADAPPRQSDDAPRELRIANHALTRVAVHHATASSEMLKVRSHREQIS